MIKNKAIILAPLLFAWIVIFAHSILPHNHHNESESECKHSHSTDSHDQHTAVFLEHHHSSETHDHCHFNINTTLTKFVDSPYAYLHSHNYTNLPVLTQTQPLQINNNELLLKHIYFESISHRGPPSFS